MAFDQSTRNRLQKFVNDARNLLTEEFTRQLQATYGLDPKAGSVATVDSLTHLDNRQCQTANILRDTLAHYLATTHGKGEKDRTKQALSRIVREQAFTVLNRLAALRMAEARGFLLETIAKGYNAKGFQLYKQLAGSALGETGEAYRNYLYSVFDEFSLDLAVLFDRHSAQGRLFPRESALLELLDLINHHDIEPLWAEDETIGWIYQYFNSQEERKKMRAESQAPRNSRELAVRNQFFTPRYVVEFLTDNTLGRIWYEMTQGNTRLVDSCRYLVRRPTEVFLKPREQAPEEHKDQLKEEGEVDGQESLSQEELLKQAVYIPHRTIKDPRCIRMLDPACGSMHFGLYAFDIFERIYEEAWQLEADLSAEAFVREGDLKPLHQSYDSFEDYKTEIPRLILEHNIHGVDIDPRAVQIAGLSLWQRAQRAWQQQGIKPQQRPVVRKSNIVCAEPMPGEKTLLQEFASSLNPPVLGQLLEAIFDKMELAGEAGTLLKIEEEIQSSIHEARDQWQARSGTHSVGDMFQAELDDATPQKTLGFNLSGVDDESFWDGAEKLILTALSDYADKAESTGDQKRLFAEDAAKGFAFIDLCRKRFDVVLMNPPFGESASQSDSYINKNYPSWGKNILCAFLERLSNHLIPGGYTASVIDRSPLNKSSYQKFREDTLLSDNALEIVLDLGWGVLDANVEVSSIIIGERSSTTKSSIFIDARKQDLDLKSTYVCEAISNLKNIFIHKTEDFVHFPNSALVYELPDGLLRLFSLFGNFSSHGYTGYTGHQLQSERHFRLFWELPTEEISEYGNKYVKMYNGGEFTRYSHPRRDVVIFGPYSKIGSDNFPSYSYRIQNKNKHFKSGVGFGVRGDVLDAHLINDSDTLFTVEGQCIPIIEGDDRWFVLAVLNSQLTSSLLNTFSGQHKYSGYVNLLPLPEIDDGLLQEIVCLTKEIYSIKSTYYEYDETTRHFSGPYLKLVSAEGQGDTIDSLVKQLVEKISIENKKVLELHRKIGGLILKAYKVDDRASIAEVERDFINAPEECVPVWGSIRRADIREKVCFDLINYLVGCVFGKFDGVNSDIACIEEDEKSAHSLSSLVSEISDVKYLEDLKAVLGIPTGQKAFSEYFSQTNRFFEEHLRKFTCSRRQSPLYWPLQTPSGSYTLWIYYHRLNVQTLYVCVNDFIEPKLERITKDITTLRGVLSRNRQQEKELEKLSDLASELHDFRDELLRIAKFWKPNLNDGVQITAAPLWKLFQHKAWQKKLKETWEKLEKGDYDWAHLACSIWPERVLRKCHQDRSLAIAHDVEDIFWHEVEVPIMRGKKATGQTKLEWQPKTLSDAELNALIQAKIKEMNA